MVASRKTPPENVEMASDPYAHFEKLLVKNGKLRSGDLHRARRLVAQTDDERLPAMLVRLGLVAESDITQVLAEVSGTEVVTSDGFPDVSPLGDEISLRFLKSQGVVGIAGDDDSIVVAVRDPLDDYMRSALELACDKTIEVKVGTSSDIERALERQYGAGKSAMGQLADDINDDVDYNEEDIEHLKDLASEAPIIRMVNIIMQKAVESRASDIHIEPFDQNLKVRFRVDGVLQDVEAPPVQSTAAVISRIKIMAKLNIAERRLPQDGRIKHQVQGKELDLRVSTIPTMYGESVVIRLLDKEGVVLDFEALGFHGETLQQFNSILGMPHGIVLITGPTGSGKSTTLYTALQQLNTPERKIITVEDPVEYQLEGVNQIQTKSKIGLTFASALRSIVRQDPDVIMIGEMRDLETARIAVQSALTGHVVLSTLHTNDAAGGITRLMDMGLEDYLLTSTVNGILGQRLVRRLCPHCREPYTPLPEVIEELKLKQFAKEKEIQLYHPKGCEQCGDVGYRGRLAILEFLTMTDALRSLVMGHAQALQIEERAIQEGMETMYQNGLRKALAGVTTIEEVLRVTTDA